MEHKTHFLNSRGKKLSAVLHIPSKKASRAVILCPGYKSSKDDLFFPELADSLEKSGFIVLRFDFENSGESGGDYLKASIIQGISDLKKAIEFVKEKGAKKVSLCGHSLGALICLLSPGNMPVVAISPPVEKPKKIPLGFLWKKLGVIYRIRMKKPSILKLSYGLFEERRSYDIDAIAPLIDSPVLFIYGENDKVTPFESGLKISRLIKNSKFAIIKGTGHNFKSGKKQLIKTATDFLVKNG